METTRKSPHVGNSQGQHERLSCNGYDNLQVAENTLFVKCNVDNIQYFSKENARNEYGSIAYRLKKDNSRKELTIPEMLSAWISGYAINEAYHEGGKSEASFISQQVFIADIDNENSDNYLYPEKAIEILQSHGLEYSFVYYTFSHSLEKPKFRIGIVLDIPVYDKTICKQFKQAFVELFSQADKATTDLARSYLGTNKTDYMYNASGVCKQEQLAKLYADRVAVNIQPKTYEPVQFKPSNVNITGDIDIAKEVSSFDLKAFCEQSLGIEFIKSGEWWANRGLCPVCGHKDCFSLGIDKHTFRCFGDNGKVSGNILNLIGIVNNYDKKQARDYFKYNILGDSPDKEKARYKESLQKNEVALSQSKQNRVNNNKSLNKGSSQVQQKMNIPFERDTLQLVEKLKVIKPEQYTLDDIGMSKLFTECFRSILVYNTSRKSYMFFNGKSWQDDVENMRSKQYAEQLITAYILYNSLSSDTALKEQRGKSLAKYTSCFKRETIVKDSQKNYFINEGDLDKNIDFFNCQNGTLNLKTLDFKPHDPKDLLSRISEVVYDSNAKSTIFEKFISAIMQGNTEKTHYLQKMLGYALTADNSQETCFILYGATTRNGKGTLVETFMHMLGSTGGYALSMNPETLAQKKNADSRIANGDIARLSKCRFLNASEPPKKMIFDVALLKTLLGRDTLTARFLFQNEFQFTPMFKLVINTNYLPYVNDSTLFTSGRINVISFDKHFTETERDPNLKDRLKEPENISAFFNWALQGLQSYYKENLIPPLCVQEATSLYCQASDKIGCFLEECFEKDIGNTKSNDAYTAFMGWCKENGFGIENKKNFLNELKAKGLLATTGTVNGLTYKNVIKGYLLTL